MQQTDVPQTLFVTAPVGMEDLLVTELASLGAEACRPANAGAFCVASLQTAYAICLGSRIANRVLLPLGTWDAPDADALYAGALGIDWASHLDPADTFTIDVTLRKADITHSHYAAQRVKDAIVDGFRDSHGTRPTVDRQQPGVRFHIHIHHATASASVDLSGGSLHQRGVRQAAGAAPLKENLAAAVLKRSGWPDGSVVVDPMCGSGTLLIEAVLMALHWAPGLLWAERERPTRSPAWRGHQAAAWQAAYDAADAAQRSACADASTVLAYGSDIDPACVQIARDNIANAGLSRFIQVVEGDVTACRPPAHVSTGHVVTNPPYGERLGDMSEAMALHATLGATLQEHFVGWQAHVLTLDENLGKSLGLRAKKVHALYNGAIPCKLVHCVLAPPRVTSCKPADAAPDFANRLRKNVKRLKPWADKNNIFCYRVYDADIPEYSVAIDRYEDHIHVQEYAAPKEINPARAQARLRDIVLSIPEAMQVDPAQVFVKVRQRQRGTKQYEKVNDRNNFIKVREGEHRFWVNLTDYLDTGLFVDHRPMRALIQSLAPGKSFLNLFAYTGTATVYAAAGGATQTTTVDMSRTYLEWAEQNFRLNALRPSHDHIVQEDCFSYLQNTSHTYDLILLDPPTFSNSKRMTNTLDIQRDHVDLIKQTAALLNPGGILLFSTNMRRFKLDANALAYWSPEDITARTIDTDFARSPRIHQAFRLTQPS